MAAAFGAFYPKLKFRQRYHVDDHSQIAIKQLRLSFLSEMRTNLCTGPRV